jgi:dTDP-4-dehydrorhamnose 3,5-epimerase
MLDVEQTAIPDVKLLKPNRFGDARGFFSEVYSQRTFAQAGLDLSFVQDNHSWSAPPFTVRGLHFQTPPAAQGKLVRVVRGRVLDVAVDLRRSSKTYGHHVAVELSAENWFQLWVPAGFAHGFCTLEPDCEVLYKVTEYYSAEHDRGLAWDDPALGIPWPVGPGAAVLSAKDTAQPRLSDLPPYFD